MVVVRDDLAAVDQRGRRDDGIGVEEITLTIHRGYASGKPRDPLAVSNAPPLARSVLAVRPAVEVVALAVAEEVAVAVRIELPHHKRRADVCATGKSDVAPAGVLAKIYVWTPVLILA